MSAVALQSTLADSFLADFDDNDDDDPALAAQHSQQRLPPPQQQTQQQAHSTPRTNQVSRTHRTEHFSAAVPLALTRRSLIRAVWCDVWCDVACVLQATNLSTASIPHASVPSIDRAAPTVETSIPSVSAGAASSTAGTATDSNSHGSGESVVVRSLTEGGSNGEHSEAAGSGCGVAVLRTTVASAAGEPDESADADTELAADASLRSSSSLSPLLTSGTLPAHLSALSALLHSSSISSEREYPYLTTSIRLLAHIDSEIALVHRYLLGVYSVRYRELEQLVASPVYYARVARLLGNFRHGGDVSGVERELQAFLPNNVVLTISVTAATSSGRPLTDDELNTAMEAAASIVSLDDGRQRIVSYMESRMSVLAPNLSALIGSTIAAQLLSVAGGLRKLSEIPACNVQVLGSRKQRHSALSSSTQELHVGAIGQSAVMLGCPMNMRRRAARLVAGKVTLAARVDEHNENPSGDSGREMRAHIEAKIELWQQPPPTALTKALPVPLAQSNKKKRGGKRFRREKERYTVSELHKQKNRMAFGKEELVDEYTGEEFGMMGQHEGTGQVRSRERDTQQLSSRLSRDRQKRAAYGTAKGKQGTGTPAAAAGSGGGGGRGSDGGVGGAVTVIGGGGGGTASSIAFTPVQGMELVNNEQKRLKLADSQLHDYFAATASFSSQAHKQLPRVPKF